MILLVPVYPEVPKPHRPRLWPGLVLVLLLGIVYLEVHPILKKDAEYLDSIKTFLIDDSTGHFQPEAANYLRKRPLLRLAPAPGDWDLLRLITANFLHGSEIHLFLNLIGVFAGARICATFLPFLCLLAIFVVGGSLGLFASIRLSSEISQFIPHIGASAGIFALMGTYYVYNFRYRTKYFFWFPTRSSNLIALKTSWFFFFDVILIELLVSTAQLFPTHLDNVDHIAHVVGFFSGCGLALLLRAFQGWPLFIQTRAEYMHWANLRRPRDYHPIFTPFRLWHELLEINAYNDQIKIKYLRMAYLVMDKLSDTQLELPFQFLSPTFVRLYPHEVALIVKEMVAKNRPIPQRWLLEIPYDCIIRIAQQMAYPPEEQAYLYRFVMEYRKVHPEEGDLVRKLELLMSKLDGLLMAQAMATDPIPRSTVPRRQKGS